MMSEVSSPPPPVPRGGNSGDISGFMPVENRAQRPPPMLNPNPNEKVPANRAPIPDKVSKEDQEKALRESMLEYDRIMHTQASQIRSDLSYACVVPAILLISMGGKPGLLCLSFGGVATYLLDLLESVEGSLISLALTFLAFTACVIWGMRDFLSSSFLNILVFLVMGVSILLIFLTSICQYNVILFDVGIFNNMMLQIMFASMPLMFSTLIAGVVAVEAPEFDIITTFNIAYFLYAYFLCRPRLLFRGGVSQNGFRITRERKAHGKPLLSEGLLRLILSVPLLISLCAHFAIHRRLAMTESSRWFHFAFVFLFSRFLMSFCVYDHQERIIENKEVYHKSEDVIFALTILALGHFLPSHPFFDELKTFCEAEDPLPSRVLSMLGTMIAAAILVHVKLLEMSAVRQHEASFDDFGRSTGRITTGFRFSFFKLILDILIGLIIIMSAFLLNLDEGVIPIAMFGGIALNELYHKDDWNVPSLLMLAVIGCLTVSVVFKSFAESTIAPLRYDMTGLYDVSLHDFTSIVGTMLTLATVSPALISLLGRDASRLADMVLPQSFSLGSGNSNGSKSALRRQFDFFFGPEAQTEWIAWAHHVYGIIFVVIALVTVFLELLLLDQNWESINVNSDLVYPSEYVFATAGMLFTTAFACYRAKIIGLYSIVIVGAANAIKMLYFFDYDPATIYALLFVLLAAAYPFFDQLQLSIQLAEAIDQLKFSSQAYEDAKENIYRTPWQHQVASVTALILILLSPLGQHISVMCLESILAGDKDALQIVLWQEVMFSVALWVAYIAIVVFVFYPRMELLRNVCLCIALVLMLIAGDGFGILVWNSDTQFLQPLDETHSFLMRGHSQFYLILSCLLTIATMTQYLNLETLFSCVSYSAAFGFVSTKAMIDWSFPVSLQASSSYQTSSGSYPLDSLVNRDVYYPFLFLWVMKSLWTFTALYSRKDRATEYSVLFTLSFYASVFLPIFAVTRETWQLHYDVNDHVLARELHTGRIVGIIWSTLCGMLALAGSIRGREILFLMEGGVNNSSNSSNSQPHRQPSKKNNLNLAASFEVMAAKFIKYYYQQHYHQNSLSGDDAQNKKLAARALLEHITPLPGSAGRTSAVALVVCVGLFWAISALVFHTTALDADILLPAVALLLFFTLDSSVLVSHRWFTGYGCARASAIDVWVFWSSLWWYSSLLYHVFYLHYQVRHLGVDALAMEMQHRRIMVPYSIFGWDSNISLWSNASVFLPLLNLALACIPLPGLLFVLHPRLMQASNEDVLFILGVVNLAPLIGGSVDCVRYLALVSAALCIYRSYSLANSNASKYNSSHRNSNSNSYQSSSSSSSSNSMGAAIATAAGSLGGNVGAQWNIARDRYL